MKKKAIRILALMCVLALVCSLTASGESTADRHEASQQVETVKAMAGSLAAGWNHTVGLKSDGTVAAVGWNVFGQCDVSGWKDIVAVAAGDYHTVGLKSDGTVVAVGYKV